MSGSVTPNGLWLPGEGKHRGGKQQGGSYFDDELESANTVFMNMVKDLLAHLRERRDHVVYVGSTKDREQLREVFNWWKREGFIDHNPTIKIDYGVPEGTIRVTEDRD